MSRIKCPECPTGYAHPDHLNGWAATSFGPLIAVTCHKCGYEFNAYARDLD